MSDNKTVVSFDVDIRDKHLETVRTNGGFIVGNFLSKKVDYYFEKQHLNIQNEIVRLEALRIMNSILTLNPELKVEVVVRYNNKTTETWTEILTERNDK